MSLEYAEKRIKEAVKLHGKNKTKIRQQIIAWTYEDHKLLQALTKPHLSGIVAYHMERVMSGRSDKAKTPAPMPKKPLPKNTKTEDFGLEIMRALVNAPGATFGFEDSGAPRAKRGKVSASHVDALKQMAAKSTTKPGKK
jgi:hypothetical protein